MCVYVYVCKRESDDEEEREIQRKGVILRDTIGVRGCLRLYICASVGCRLKDI